MKFDLFTDLISFTIFTKSVFICVNHLTKKILRETEKASVVYYKEWQCKVKNI